MARLWKEKKKFINILSDFMKVLIPLLSEMENEEFLKRATEKASEVILLLVVDTQPNQKFGFTTSQITKGRRLMENASSFIGKKKKIEEIIEWGETDLKIINIAKLNQVDKIVIKEQGENNFLFKGLVEKIKSENIKVEVI
jgi:hypothetical protein